MFVRLELRDDRDRDGLDWRRTPTKREAIAVLVVVLGSGCVAPAIAQTAPAAPAQKTAADADFLAGLKRLGVIAGQSVECASDATRAAEIEKVSAIGDDIAVEYGLRASFNFIGAAGYGSGKPFDKATCADVMKEWKAVQAKYGEK